MERLPFGISRLDSVIDGGAPPGSVVLLSGEAGAGAREFMYTSAVMNSLANEGHELFDLHYGDLADASALPDEVHYLSFTADADQLDEEIGMAMDDEIVDSALDAIEFQSLSRQYFHVSPVPRDWYASEAPDIKNLRKRHEEREGLLSALGRELSSRAPGNLVVIDSLSDLAGALGEDIEWSDVTYLVRGIQKAAYDWGAHPPARQPRHAVGHATGPARRRLQRDDDVQLGDRRLDPGPDPRRPAVPGRPLADRGGKHRHVRDRPRGGGLRHQRRPEDPLNRPSTGPSPSIVSRNGRQTLNYQLEKTVSQWRASRLTTGR